MKKKLTCLNLFVVVKTKENIDTIDHELSQTSPFRLLKDTAERGELYKE